MSVGLGGVGLERVSQSVGTVSAEASGRGDHVCFSMWRIKNARGGVWRAQGCEEELKPEM